MLYPTIEFWGMGPLEFVLIVVGQVMATLTSDAAGVEHVTVADSGSGSCSG